MEGYKRGKKSSGKGGKETDERGKSTEKLGSIGDNSAEEGVKKAQI